MAKSMTNLPDFTVLFKHHWKFSKHTRSGSATLDFGIQVLADVADQL